jgi:predicted ATPase/DNA-binding CsgD family transcriptional regulator
VGPKPQIVPDPLRAAGVTRRELEIFWLVADRLHNKEIAERLHVSARTVESHVSSLLGKLGAPDRQALVEAGARLRDRSRSRDSLPRPVSSFVGRGDEIEEILRLVSAHRLVTLTGPAGAGKTRLALHVAAAADSLPPAVLVDLAVATSDENVVRLFADSLTLVPESRLRSALREALTAGPHWLLVDNCEHVAEATAVLLAELLSSTSQLRVLATSRAPLGVAGEAVYQLAPLPLPPETDDPEAVLAAPSARLFADRAATAWPPFTVTADNARDVAELCRRLDGLPLAIELAAPRVRTFTPAELLLRLEDRFALLTSGSPGASGRHLTLDGALRWSYELLDDAERRLLERCSVFPAEFDYDTAAEIAAFQPLERADLVRLFPRLLDRSLISASRRGQSTAYRMLESIRDFARAQLALSGEEEVIHERHALYHLGHGPAALAALQGRDQVAAMAWFDLRWADLRAAMQWALGRQDIDLAWGFVAGVGTGWEILGMRGELFDWLEVMLERPLPIGGIRPQAVATAVMLLSHQDAGRAVSIAQDFYLESDRRDDRGHALAELSLGWALMFSGARESATAHLREAATRFDRLDDQWHRALALEVLGLGEHETSGEALGSIALAADLFGGLHDDVKRANCLIQMAGLNINFGTGLNEAEVWLAEARQLAERTGNHHELLHAELFRARLDQMRVDGTSNAPQFARLLDAFRRIGDRRCVARCLLGLGRAAVADGDYEPARRHLTECAFVADAVGDPLALTAALRLIARCDYSAGLSRHAAIVLGAADGAVERVDIARRRALPKDDDLRAQLENELQTAGLNAAIAEGRQVPIKQLFAH